MQPFYQIFHLQQGNLFCLYIHAKLEVALNFPGDYLICGIKLIQYAFTESHLNSCMFIKEGILECLSDLESKPGGLIFSVGKIFSREKGRVSLKRTKTKPNKKQQPSEYFKDQCGMDDQGQNLSWTKAQLKHESCICRPRLSPNRVHRCLRLFLLLSLLFYKGIVPGIMPHHELKRGLSFLQVQQQFLSSSSGSRQHHWRENTSAVESK